MHGFWFMILGRGWKLAFDVFSTSSEERKREEENRK